MDLRIVIAILGGIVIGMAAFAIAVTAGLSVKEIYFLAEFWKSLRAGEYEIQDEEEDEKETSSTASGPPQEGKAHIEPDNERRNEHG